MREREKQITCVYIHSRKMSVYSQKKGTKANIEMCSKSIIYNWSAKQETVSQQRDKIEGIT